MDISTQVRALRYIAVVVTRYSVITIRVEITGPGVALEAVTR